MDKEIEELREEREKIELLLYEKVMEKDNHMNPCDCDNSVVYHFINFLPDSEITSFCLNCGGFVEDGE